MIQINRDNLETLCLEYFSFLEKIIPEKDNRIFTVFKSELKKYTTSHFTSFDSLINIFRLTFRSEIEVYEKKYFSNSREEKKEAKKTEYGEFITLMHDCYNSTFSRVVKIGTKDIKLGIWLAKSLNINTCPYCNRQYTFTINKNKKIRPQFDHFYPKSKYPFLALSFYNLIPSCPTCNLAKTDSDLKLIYPYLEGFSDKCMFTVNHREYIMNGETIKVKPMYDKKLSLPDRNRHENSINTFALTDLYNEHSDYIAEIIDKAYAYNQDYYESLIDTFEQLGKTPSEIERLIFGNYIDTANTEKRPLSKLTQDILNQIGLK